MTTRMLSRYHYVQPGREVKEEEAEQLWRERKLPTPSEAEDIAAEFLLWALEHGHPVTIGFFKEYKRRDDDGTIRVIKDSAGRPLFLHTVRTYELFNMKENEDNGRIVFEAMDRCPAKPGEPDTHDKPAIRSVVAERVTDVTIHAARHRLRNMYFINKVKENVPGAAQLTEDTIWHVIHAATSREHAEKLAKAALADAR